MNRRTEALLADVDWLRECHAGVTVEWLAFRLGRNAESLARRLRKLGRCPVHAGPVPCRTCERDSALTRQECRRIVQSGVASLSGTA